MANICDNKFLVSCENEKILEKISIKLTNLFNEDLEGSIEYEDDSILEGWFSSRWEFPEHLFENFFNEFDDDTIYMRCLSEEYGCGLVSMNIYENNHWKTPQYFEL